MTTGETGSAPLDNALVYDLIERLRAYFNAHDTAFITELMAEDVVFDHPLAPATLHGRAALQAFYTGSIWKAMPDAAVELAAGPFFHPHAPSVVVIWTGTGTNTGPLNPPGLPPTGKSFQQRVWEAFELRDDGLISRISQAFDTVGLLRQLGLLPAQGSRAERGMAALQRLRMNLHRRR